MKNQEKKKAIQLRKKGHSVIYIMKELSVAKSTAYEWVKDVKISLKMQEKLRARKGIPHKSRVKIDSEMIEKKSCTILPYPRKPRVFKKKDRKKSYEHVKNFRARTKEIAVECMGSKCQICGYSKCLAGLEFHHIHSDKKDFLISDIVSWQRLKDELKKCILLCVNCHREVHEGISLIPSEFLFFNESKAELIKANFHKKRNKTI